jgi:hypothetical protein
VVRRGRGCNRQRAALLRATSQRGIGAGFAIVDIDLVTTAGVDYSTKSLHAAIVDGKRLVFAKRYDLGANRLDTMAQLVEALASRGVTTVYMEQPFFVPARLDKNNPGKIKQGSNVNTLKLHAVATEVATVLQLRGLDVQKVAPATWQSVVLLHAPGWPDRKAASVFLVRAAYGLDTKDNNLADAINIATYGELLRRRNGLIPA